jgi:hypothetical protein
VVVGAVLVGEGDKGFVATSTIKFAAWYEQSTATKDVPGRGWPNGLGWGIGGWMAGP